MTDDSEWLPPRRRHDDGTFAGPSPETGPLLNPIDPNDPAVVALTSAMADPAEALPPLDDEFVSDVHIFDVARLKDPDLANAQLAQAVPRSPVEQRLDALERKTLEQGEQIQNLTTMFKLYLYGKSLP